MPYVPSFDAMRGPRSAFLGIFVDEDFCAGGRHRRFVKIERSVHVSLGGEPGVAVGWSEEVQGVGSLMDKPVPEVERKVGVNAGYASDKVVLPRADGFFCGVGAVIMRGNELKNNFFFPHESCEAGRTFVVQEGNTGGEAAFNEEGMDGGERLCEFAIAAAFEAAG